MAEQVNFDAYNDEDINDYKPSKLRSESNITSNNNNKPLEIVIKKEQCTEIGCFIQTHNQCKYCRQFKCNNHLQKICGLFGGYCTYCYKRKLMIFIGGIICVAIILALIFYLMHMMGVYS